MDTAELLAPLHSNTTAWRRDIHAHPELGFHEVRTAELVARQLEAVGIDVQRGVGRTGVVGTLRVGASGRSIGLRADMDALPVQEANRFAHASRRAGVVHAYGAATHLAHTRQFDGTVHFIFQPAEEGLGGARAMIDDGLFERFPSETILGMHHRPGLLVGGFAVHAGL